jgi:outer membrane receptor for ferrienterochelin and colicins
VGLFFKTHYNVKKKLQMKWKKHRLVKSGFGLMLCLCVVSTSMYAQEVKSSDSAQDVDPSKKSFEELSEMSLEELLNMPIMVASKSEEKISDAGGVISVLTRDELDRFGGLTLRDILERVPSLIGIRSYFSEGYGLASRGDQLRINSGHNLILINGRPTREIVEGGISTEMYAAFPIDIIERIEVIRGPGSVLYGSNAFSTVINIITQQNNETNVKLKALAGPNGAVGTMGQAELKFGDVNVVAAGRYMKKGNWRPSYSAVNFFDPMAPPIVTDSLVSDEAHGAYLGATYKGLKVTGAHNQFQGTDFQFGTQNDKWQKTFGNIGYDLHASDAWNMSFNVTYNYATFKSGPFPGITRYSKDFVAEWTNMVDLSSKLKVTFGGLYNHIKGKENMNSLGETVVLADKSRGSIALYTQVDYWAVKTLKLIGGLQANKVDHLDIDLVPRGGVVWYPVKRVNVKALYSQAFRAASVDEFALNHEALKGNPNIRPEKVSTIDFGVNYFGEKVQGGVNFFHSTLSDIIAPESQMVDGVFLGAYANKGKVIFNGVEVEGKYYISRSLFLTGSILYQENENDAEVKNNTPIANFGAKAGLSYRWNKGVTASLFNIYQGDLDEKYTTNPFGNLNPKTGSYNILNMYLDFNIVKLFNLKMTQGLGVFVQGDNILDKKIWGPDWGGFTPGNSIPVNRGRAIYAGVKLSLK